MKPQTRIGASPEHSPRDREKNKMTNVSVRDPFGDIRSVMRRAFDEPFFSRQWRGDFVPTGRDNSASHALALDVYETEAGLTVEAPVPGFDKDDVEVTLEKGKLTIRAEKSEKSEEAEETTEKDGRKYFIRERRSGSVFRSLLVGDSWDPDAVSATIKDGVLVLTIGKAKDAQRRQIAIS